MQNKVRCLSKKYIIFNVFIIYTLYGLLLLVWSFENIMAYSRENS